MEVEVDGCDNKEVEEWIYESSPHAKPHPGTYERDTDFRKDKRLGEGVSKKGRGNFGTSGNPGRPSEFAPADEQHPLVHLTPVCPVNVTRTAYITINSRYRNDNQARI